MKKSIFLTFALLLSLTQFHPVAAQVARTPETAASDKYADKLRAFEEFVRQQMDKNKVPGLTIGFVKDDYMWVKGFGYSDLDDGAIIFRLYELVLNEKFNLGSQ